MNDTQSLLPTTLTLFERRYRLASSRAFKGRLLAFIAGAIAVIGIHMLVADMTTLWMSMVGIFALCMTWVVPLHYSLFAYFVYLFFDGSVKMLSNYHPIAHIAQDLLLGALVIRSLANRRGHEMAVRFTKTPFFSLFLLFLIWLFLQYANPFGLGILPSLSGTKIYVSMIFFFFLCYHHLKPEHFDSLFKLLLLLGTIQAALACVEYLYGQDWMFNLHPRYKMAAGERFTGPFYRPFGTTALHGGPSVWVSLVAPIAAYLLHNPNSSLVTRINVFAFILVSVPALIFCQVRVAMFNFLAMLLIVSCAPGKGLKRRLSTFAIIGGVAGLALFPSLKRHLFESEIRIGGFSDQESILANVLPNGTSITPMHLQVLRNRFNTFASQETMFSTRGGALGASLELAQYTVFGIGLSRVGAASAVWSDLIKRDPLFGPRWSFTDNLFLTIFTELGILGLIAWVLLVGSLILTVLKKAFRSIGSKDHLLIWTCGMSAMILVAGGVVNEGVLYAPVSCFFWLMLAIGMRAGAYDHA